LRIGSVYFASRGKIGWLGLFCLHEVTVVAMSHDIHMW